MIRHHGTLGRAMYQGGVVLELGKYKSNTQYRKSPLFFISNIVVSRNGFSEREFDTGTMLSRQSADGRRRYHLTTEPCYQTRRISILEHGGVGLDIC